ncbi:protein AMN1 homolog [Schistocerca piceifrons]|uniref:protein AMN1 homolog n=1 Tax=Schistocerca piceifrons TaxID=274613 RepID=UPI001F5F4747|nr:protein AMN1 homolog [Schistocerca piceifrons]
MQIRSLLQMCIETIVSSNRCDCGSLKLLPPNLKTRILVVFTKRGNISNNSLSSLLHPGITKLDLSECEIDNKSLEAVSVCQQLRKLDLNPGRNQIRNLSVTALSQLFQSLPYLSKLSMRRIFAVTDEVIISVSQYCPLLSELDIGGCTHITDESLMALRNLNSLTAINIAHSEVTDAGVISLVSGESRETLSEFRLEMCKKVTDDSIEAIIYNCRNIKYLVFHGCSVIGDWHEAMEAMGCHVKDLRWTVY